MVLSPGADTGERSSQLINIVGIFTILERVADIIQDFGPGFLVSTATLIGRGCLTSRVFGGNHRFEPTWHGKVIHTSASS
jgi:hypothetical protein